MYKSKNPFLLYIFTLRFEFIGGVGIASLSIYIYIHGCQYFEKRIQSVGSFSGFFNWNGWFSKFGNEFLLLKKYKKIRAGDYQQKSNTHHPNTGKEDGAKSFLARGAACHVCSLNYGHNNNKLSDSAVPKENFVIREAKMSVSREN